MTYIVPCVECGWFSLNPEAVFCNQGHAQEKVEHCSDFRHISASVYETLVQLMPEYAKHLQKIEGKQFYKWVK